jgi:hypothetical protein
MPEDLHESERVVAPYYDCHQFCGSGEVLFCDGTVLWWRKTTVADELLLLLEARLKKGLMMKSPVAKSFSYLTFLFFFLSFWLWSDVKK